MDKTDLKRFEELWWTRNPVHDDNADTGKDMFWGTAELIAREYMEPEISELTKENKALREGIEREIKLLTQYYYKTNEGVKRLQSLLSTPITPISKDKVDKSTGIVDKEWSEWFSYKGEVDFKDGIVIEVEWNNNDINEYTLDPKLIFPWYGVLKYRIKLDGVSVFKYLSGDDGEHLTDKIGNGIPYDIVIGHDPQNKIIIIKE